MSRPDSPPNLVDFGLGGRPAAGNPFRDDGQVVVEVVVLSFSR